MIKLVNLLHEANISDNALQKLATEMGETIVNFLGSGANGKAYETSSGRVIKYTEDSKEVALASRLRTKRLYKHIINVYDVRPIENLPGSYLILMDKIVEPLDQHKNWAEQWNYIKRNYFGKDMTDKQFLNWITSTNGQWLDFDMDFINKILPQRTGIQRDFSELRIVVDEAHAGNMGWNTHGNLVHYDGWQKLHYTQASQNDNTSHGHISKVPVKRGLNKALRSVNDGN